MAADGGGARIPWADRPIEEWREAYAADQAALPRNVWGTPTRLPRVPAPPMSREEREALHLRRTGEYLVKHLSWCSEMVSQANASLASAQRLEERAAAIPAPDAGHDPPALVGYRIAASDYRLHASETMGRVAVRMLETLGRVLS